MLYPPSTSYPYTWPRAYAQPINRPTFQPVYPTYPRQGQSTSLLNQSQPTRTVPAKPTNHHPSSVNTPGSTLNTGIWAGIIGGGGVLAGLLWWLTKPTPQKPVQQDNPTSAEAPSGSAKPQAASVEQQPELPKIKVSPKFQNPAYCDEIAWKIADDSFPEVLKILQNFKPSSKDHKCSSGSHLIYDPRLSELISRSVQKYLDPHCTARFDIFYDSRNIGSTSGDHFKAGHYASNTQSIELSLLSATSPKPVTRRQIQSLYTTYSHEIRHMVQAFAEGPLTPPKEIPRSETDSCKKLYSLLELRHTLGGPSTLYPLLKEEYPCCADINLKDPDFSEFTNEQLGRYWKAVNDLWQRTDLPMLKDDPRVEGWKTLFEKGEPIRVDDGIDYQVIREMEAYRMCLKRPPGSPKQYTETELRDMAPFLFLRDVLRLYYQVKKTPKEQQHPYVQPEYAKAHPLEIFV